MSQQNMLAYSYPSIIFINSFAHPHGRKHDQWYGAVLFSVSPPHREFEPHFTHCYKSDGWHTSHCNAQTSGGHKSG